MKWLKRWLGAAADNAAGISANEQAEFLRRFYVNQFGPDLTVRASLLPGSCTAPVSQQ